MNMVYATGVAMSEYTHGSSVTLKMRTEMEHAILEANIHKLKAEEIIEIDPKKAMREMVGAAAKRHDLTHKTFVEGCSFCRIDKAVIDAIFEAIKKEGNGK